MCQSQLHFVNIVLHFPHIRLSLVCIPLLGVSFIIIMANILYIKNTLTCTHPIFFPVKYVNIFPLMHLTLEGVHKNSIQ